MAAFSGITLALVYVVSVGFRPGLCCVKAASGSAVQADQSTRRWGSFTRWVSSATSKKIKMFGLGLWRAERYRVQGVPGSEWTFRWWRHTAVSGIGPGTVSPGWWRRMWTIILKKGLIFCSFNTERMWIFILSSHSSFWCRWFSFRGHQKVLLELSHSKCTTVCGQKYWDTWTLRFTRFHSVKWRLVPFRVTSDKS